MLLRWLYVVPMVVSLCAQVHGQDSAEIQVHLQTESALKPTYLSCVQTKASAFDSAYHQSVENLLGYDLSYNGSTQLIARSQEKEARLQAQDSKVAFDPAFWKANGISYVLKWAINGKVLSLTACSFEDGSVKSWSEILLTGNITKDRQQIHKLADSVHEAFFKTPGIASSRILFSYQVKNSKADGSDWISEIWECDWDGANARQITSEGSYCVTPVWMPNHPKYAQDRFLYVSYKNGQPKIYISSLSEGRGRRLVDLPGNQLLPAVSPRRDQIAFICDAGGRTDLFLQKLDPASGELSKPVQLYSYPRSTQASPTFHPDGSKIAFVSDKDGGMRIYTIPTAVGHKRANAVLISKQNRENSCPSWSPDGTKIAYSAKTNHIRQIWIYDFSSGEEWQLTAGPTNKENPCWAPDSKHIVFNSTDGATSELYIVNLNQPEAVKITKGPGKKHYPSWGTR